MFGKKDCEDVISFFCFGFNLDFILKVVIKLKRSIKEQSGKEIMYIIKIDGAQLINKLRIDLLNFLEIFILIVILFLFFWIFGEDNMYIIVNRFENVIWCFLFNIES